MKRVVRWRALVVAAPLLAVLCLTISAAGAGAAGRPPGTTVAPRPLIPRGATRLGAVSPTKAISGAVVLQPRDESALAHFISQVTDRHSPLFHRYLTPATFAAKFGATSSSIAAVESQLQAAGLTVTNVAPDGLIVDFTAPASRVESEFQTGLERYKLANGSTEHARTAPLKVPATIGRYVTSVVGLDTTVRLRPLGLPRSTRSAAAAHPAALHPKFTHPAGSPTACSDASDAAQEFGGLTDDQIANSYGAFGLYGAGDTGSGQHIAVYELEPFATSDLQTFDTCYFGATQAASMLSRVHTVNVDGGPGAGPGSGESILDIQDVSAFAPGANIDVYQAPLTTFGSLDEYAKIVNDDVDQVVTTSWGFCEQGLQEGSPGVQQAENLIFEQAAAQGQSVFSAAGDEGSDDCNSFETTSPVSPVLSVDDPSSQPYVVAAGGTTIDDATQPALEHVWNDGPVGGAAGGGISESWPMPAWQDSFVVQTAGNSSAVTAANAFEANDLGAPGYRFCASDNPVGGSEDGCRELPDVSAASDEFTGAITIFSAQFGGWTTIGGTSSAAPMWAGMLADVNASPTCQANNATQSGVGFVSPLLYSVAANPTAYAASFNDITLGNNDAFGDSNLFQSGTGYDMASGLGTPELTQPNGQAGLAFYLCSQAPAVTRPTVTNLSPASGLTSATDTSVTITGTNFEQSGVPDVAKIQVGERRARLGVVHGRQPDADHRRPPGCLLVRAAERPDGRRGRVPGDRQAERRRDERGQPEHRVHVRGRQRFRGCASDRDRRPYLRRRRSGRQHRPRLRRRLLGSDERHLRRRGRVDVHGQSERDADLGHRSGLPGQRHRLRPERLELRRDRHQRHLPGAGAGDDAERDEPRVFDRPSLRGRGHVQRHRAYSRCLRETRRLRRRRNTTTCRRRRSRRSRPRTVRARSRARTAIRSSRSAARV